MGPIAAAVQLGSKPTEYIQHLPPSDARHHWDSVNIRFRREISKHSIVQRCDVSSVVYWLRFRLLRGSRDILPDDALPVSLVPVHRDE